MFTNQLFLFQLERKRVDSVKKMHAILDTSVKAEVSFERKSTRFYYFYF